MCRSSNEKCAVFLISGFLGSGKTTLLKHLLDNVPEGEKIAVLINEFGKAGVDGDVVCRDGLKVIEISRGSIFCACAKGDFLRSLFSLFRNYSPSILLIEASGASDTTDIKRDIVYGRLSEFYKFIGNICVVDAMRFESWLDLFNAVKKQIQAATNIVINKIDLVSAENLEKLRLHIRQMNPDAEITQTTYGNIPWTVLIQKIHDNSTGKASIVPLPEEWEEYISKTLADTSAHLLPPDKLSSLSVFWSGNIMEFKKLLSELPVDIVRSKGYFFDTDGKWKLFDIVGNKEPIYSELGKDFRNEKNLAIFIRTEKNRREIPQMFQDKGLKLIEVRF